MSKIKYLHFKWPENAAIFSSIAPAANPKKPAFMLKKMLAEYVWDLVFLEDNPYSFVEVQTLLSGITVGNYSLFDQQQVLNQKHCLDYLASKCNEK